MTVHVTHDHKVRTLRCSLCGTQRGDGWAEFSDHIYKEHTPADAGLTPLRKETVDWEKVPV